MVFKRYQGKTFTVVALAVRVTFARACVRLGCMYRESGQSGYSWRSKRAKGFSVIAALAVPVILHIGIAGNRLLQLELNGKHPIL